MPPRGVSRRAGWALGRPETSWPRARHTMPDFRWAYVRKSAGRWVAELGFSVSSCSRARYGCRRGSACDRRSAASGPSVLPAAFSPSSDVSRGREQRPGRAIRPTGPLSSPAASASAGSRRGLIRCRGGIEGAAAGGCTTGPVRRLRPDGPSSQGLRCGPARPTMDTFSFSSAPNRLRDGSGFVIGGDAPTSTCR